MNTHKKKPNLIATKAERDRNFSNLVNKAIDHQKRVRLFGQMFLMLTGFGLFFSAIYCASQPEHSDFARDFELFALFGLLVGSFGFACYHQDNKNKFN